MHDVTFQAACAAFLGVASCTVGAMLGVEPQALIYAFVGAAAGLMFTPPGGRIRALALFVPSVLSGAITGSAAAAQWFGGSTKAGDWIALAAGLLFPVVASWALVNAGKVLDGVARRFGVGQ